MWSGRDSKAFFTNEKKLINLLVGNGESNLQRKREREGGRGEKEGGRGETEIQKEGERKRGRQSLCMLLH